MSTDSSSNHDPPTGTTITLTHETNWWVAKDEETGVASQGKSRQEALENLDEALQGYHGDGALLATRISARWGLTPSTTPPTLSMTQGFSSNLSCYEETF